MGIMNAGTALGMVVAPPLIVFLQMRFGWQTAFLVTGGLVFAVPRNGSRRQSNHKQSQ